MHLGLITGGTPLLLIPWCGRFLRDLAWRGRVGRARARLAEAEAAEAELRVELLGHRLRNHMLGRVEDAPAELLSGPHHNYTDVSQDPEVG